MGWWSHVLKMLKDDSFFGLFFPLKKWAQKQQKRSHRVKFEKRKRTDQMPEQPTSKLTSAAKLKAEAGPALICVYLSMKGWVSVTKLHVWAGLFESARLLE